MRLTIFFLFILPHCLFAQNCELHLSGYILDKGTHIPLAYSNVYIEELKTGVVSDSVGFFQLKALCPAEYHIEFSHIGCEPEQQFFELTKDTLVYIYLHHHAELLDEVVVHGHKEDNSAQVSSTISRSAIAKESNKNLSDILENITGVSVLKNGSGISKPVVHGLFGNRIAILNNGIAQSGQQWGNDHAPEIDPFVADHLSVVKGAAALAYGGNSLGSIIMVEAGEIKEDPHLQGNINYIFQNNGLGHTLNTQLEKNDAWAAWRLSGTLKLQGDTKTPDYFLTNTGKREGNIALQIEKKFNKHWENHFYYSLFNTEIGVLRGAHISNLTDLEQAFEREVPFYTEEAFSYQINAPRQKVQHHLLKLESKYFISDEQVLRFQYGGQLNNRKEFDVRRSGRSDVPSLSLNQFSHFFEGVYNWTSKRDWLFKMGLQFRTIDNANQAGTGILPLIPKYTSYHPSAFLILQKEKNHWLYEIGGRYDFKQFKVARLSSTTPREVEQFEHLFHNYAFSGGIKYKISTDFKTSLNLGYLLRAPEINELYSSGLHQGVSGIEEGSWDLMQEQSLKLLVSADWYLQKKLFVQALFYYQNIDDFIYLQPQNEFRLTIRGAFPLFIYEQTDARILGTDWQLTYEPIQSLKIVGKYALVRGQDRRNDLPLLNIPADNVNLSIQHALPSGERWKNSFVSVNGKYVFQQSRLLPEQDFLLPPDDYFLLGVNVGTSLQLKQSRLEWALVIENALNMRYRDYLNRLRYFADEMGLNVSCRVNYVFSP